MYSLIRVVVRFLAPLAVVVSAMALLSMPLVDRLVSRWFVGELDMRARLVANTLQDRVGPALGSRDVGAIGRSLNAVAKDERLLGLGLCDGAGRSLVTTVTFPRKLACPSTAGRRASMLRELPTGTAHVAYEPIGGPGAAAGSLVVVQDAGFIAQRSADIHRILVSVLAVLGVLATLIGVFIARLSWQRWLVAARAALSDSARPAQEGEAGPPTEAPPEVAPLLEDVQALLQEAEGDRRLREEGTQDWSPEMLRKLLREQLAGDEILVVSNREPYIHARTPSGIVVQRPASGLVTAVEPVMRACSGTWIAHGSGSADREVVDAEGCVPVPPQRPYYTLKRIWLTKEEERGYYYGFANEGLWPLCHIAHVRPVFRLPDWQAYTRINRRFADAVCSAARTVNPVVLVQDYHLALVPRMIRERLPHATIITFWHIPWPNEESFGICPWREDILAGLLGSTIIGFHTKSHCAHFIDAADRYLETRIEREHGIVCHGGHKSHVQHYPISIAWPSDETRAEWPAVEDCRIALRSRLGLPAEHMVGIGVDRLDYTKGIIERLQAVERALEKFPELVGKFTFVQIAAPSRSSLDAYQSFEARVRALALAINERFGDGGYEPVRLLIEHHDSESVIRHYRASEVCLVTSLHDGMNLVAKEFVSSRDDEGGVLVLSQFAGAARELHEALIVNPYHIEQTANAVHRALTMSREEQRLRMRTLRVQVREYNVYRWAGRMLIDAARVRERERLAERIADQPQRVARRAGGGLHVVR